MQKTYSPVLISCELAQAMVEVALAAARAEGALVSVAVVDAAGQLKAFASMDGAPVLSQEACQRKARTALLGLGSQELAQALERNQAALISMAAFSTQTLLGGGLPVRAGEHLLGAIGVGGGSMEQDILCAEAALRLLEV